MNTMENSLVKMLTEQKENLEKQLMDSDREQNRLRYMASGYIALLVQTGDAKLLQRAKEIANEADKLE